MYLLPINFLKGQVFTISVVYTIKQFLTKTYTVSGVFSFPVVFFFFFVFFLFFFLTKI